jgi:hypothetical protein
VTCVIPGPSQTARGGMTRKDIKKPAVMSDGRLFSAQEILRPLRQDVLAVFDESGARDALRDDLGGDLADATQADGAGCTGG